MPLKARYKKYVLYFKRPAGTSRGVYKSKTSWLLFLSENGITGVGECSLLNGLSIDDSPAFEKNLKDVCNSINSGTFNFDNPLNRFPAIRFGLETALLDLQNGGNKIVFPSDFTKGKSSILTNGLIWMGNIAYMQQQIQEKFDKGFSCIKLKIGAIDWESEKPLIKAMREQSPSEKLTIRVDANGAYEPEQAKHILDELAKLGVHSIEQPIKAGNWEQMRDLCVGSPIPVALDEELIGIFPFEKKEQLLKTIKPAYLVIKPGLLGGFAASNEWVELAKQMGIGWWATSALESNIGLNAIAQWTATKNNPLPQGLGTGMLFTNNIDMPISLKGEKLYFDPDPKKTNKLKPFDLSAKKKEVDKFIVKWNGNSCFIAQKTSGSTGKPKTIRLKKSAMEASAQKTLNFFKLKAGNNALLCLPVEYIAGKMMLVRSLVGGLNLLSIEPKGTPDIPQRQIHFAAMLPLQVQNLIDSGYDFKNIEILIIGGASINHQLQKNIQKIPSAVYATYGMTETCSHIALQRLNGKNPDPCFRLLNGFSISINNLGCLVIEASEFFDKPIVTSDLVEIISAREFRWLGRADNIINSGGIKISPEQLENEISELIDRECLVAGIPDEQLGQKVILIVENDTIESDSILKKIKKNLGKHRTPKEIYRVKNFTRTQAMKIDRKSTVELLFNKM